MFRTYDYCFRLIVAGLIEIAGNFVAISDLEEIYEDEDESGYEIDLINEFQNQKMII